ncbi:MAG TPA: helix-turn-helix domain-containing protein [Candidatus Deferrimicrobium sp.]|nr:helix-turn-helix domain-containing protein [Candidatus Deferrimicrobium sp.]
MTFSRYVSIQAAAQLIGVCSKTLRRWDIAKVFQPAFRTPGNHRRYDLQALLAFVRRKREDKAKCTTITP